MSQKIVSGKRIMQVLKKRGWKEVRVRGSHHILEPPEDSIFTEKVTVPVHGNNDLAPGTLASIMKETGLGNEDL